MKPSPVPSVLLFIATAMLAFGLFGRGWYVHNDETIQANSGPLWGTICIDMGERLGEGMKCETNNVFSDLGKGSMNVYRLLGLVFALTGVAGFITGGIGAILLLKKQRSAMSLTTLILIGVAALIMLGLLMVGLSKGGTMALPSYGFFVFFIGAVLSIVGCIMAMRRGGPEPRPYYPMPGGPAYGYAAQPPYGMQPPGYAPPNVAPGYAPPNVAQGHAPPVGAAPQGAGDYARPAAAPVAAPQAGPAHACGTSMTWAAQYSRWFCPRCNQYG